VKFVCLHDIVRVSGDYNGFSDDSHINCGYLLVLLFD
jgi:hypothetical protein